MVDESYGEGPTISSLDLHHVSLRLILSSTLQLLVILVVGIVRIGKDGKDLSSSKRLTTILIEMVIDLQEHTLCLKRLHVFFSSLAIPQDG